MQKLYYEDTYQKDFTAEIINVIEKDKKYHIELDNTCFYPGGTIEANDTGYINSTPVTYVYELNGKIYHVVEIKPLKVHKVKCSIDWNRRFDYMQQHLGQHIISACFVQLFNTDTISTHFSKDCSYIDIDKIIGTAEIKAVEEMSNKIVFDNINAEILYPSNAELKKLPLRKNNQTHIKSGEKVRIVKIGDISVSQCYGIHPHSTIEVQIIKVIKWSKQVSGTRIEFLCGSRAVSDCLLKESALEKMSRLLHCDASLVLDKVEGLATELNKALSEVGLLKSEVAQYEIQNMLNSCENINGIKVLKSVYEDADLKYINLLASKLITFPNVIVLFGLKYENKTQLIFMCSKDLTIISMNYLLKDAITLIDGKGGGSDFSAQGGGKNNNNLESSIEYAYSKVKACILSSCKA